MNHAAPAPPTADVAIAGAGIIGLSLGLELLRRGLSVVILDRAHAMGSASSAAGGMLAVHDPQNPPALMPLCLRSRELYPEYLAHIESLSGQSVPLRTHHTLQHRIADRSVGRPATPTDIAAFAPGLNTTGHTFEPSNFDWLEEASLDPHDLRTALPAAFLAAGGTLLQSTELLQIEATPNGATLQTSHHPISAAHFVDCRGAWAGQSLHLNSLTLPVSPVKGQMTNLLCPPHLLRCVVRIPGLYLIPRGDGRLLVGSTLEHIGFDQQPQPSTIDSLVQAARHLLPAAQPHHPPQMWAGLRPGTPDGLPILGHTQAHPHHWYATGHYRDGILLAPVTARVIAQAILGEPTDVPLHPFSPHRF